MFQVKSLNLPEYQRTSRKKRLKLINLQAMPMELIKGSFSMDHLLTATGRYYKVSLHVFSNHFEA